MARKRRYSSEQIVMKPPEAEVLIGQGRRRQAVEQVLGVPVHIRSDNGSEFATRRVR